MASPDITQTLAHHDAAISTLGGRMTGVESGLRTLQGEVHSGFAQLGVTLNAVNSKIDRFDARPQFDFHRMVGTIVGLAVLFSMIVGAIIWLTTSQFAGVIDKVSKHENIIDRLNDKLQWLGRVEQADGKKK